MTNYGKFPRYLYKTKGYRESERLTVYTELSITYTGFSSPHYKADSHWKIGDHKENHGTFIKPDTDLFEWLFEPLISKSHKSNKKLYNNAERYSTEICTIK